MQPQKKTVVSKSGEDLARSQRKAILFGPR